MMEISKEDYNNFNSTKLTFFNNISSICRTLVEPDIKKQNIAEISQGRIMLREVQFVSVLALNSTQNPLPVDKRTFKPENGI